MVNNLFYPVNCLKVRQTGHANKKKNHKTGAGWFHSSFVPFIIPEHFALATGALQFSCLNLSQYL